MNVDRWRRQIATRANNVRGAASIMSDIVNLLNQYVTFQQLAELNSVWISSALKLKLKLYPIIQSSFTEQKLII